MAPKRAREDPDAKPHKSLLSAAAEIAFPRGGGSVLTPMEIKEVSNEAKRDVLFEQQSKADEPTAKKAKKSKKSKTLSLLSKEEQEEEKNKKNKVTVDTISFSTLNEGSYVLGMVKQINKMELVLSLPDNLDGYVPITNVSPDLIKLLEAYDDQAEESEDDEEDSDEENGEQATSKTPAEFPHLSSRFVVGQYLRAKVVATTNEKARKRLELSIEPEQVNSTLDDKEDIVENAILQASVASIEDHGAILKFGKNFKTSGFISKKELASLPGTVNVGSVLLVAVSKVNSRTATCKLPIAVLKKQPILSTVSSVDALLPGMLVDATIDETTEEGLLCRVHSLCDGSISVQHMNCLQSPDDIKHKYAVGSVVKARIIATYMKNGETRLSLSVIPQHQLLEYTGKDALEAFPIGHLFDSVTLKGKSKNFFFVDLMSGEIPGEVHKSRVTDGADIDMDFKIGSLHKARVLDYAMFDNIYILTLDKAQIETKYVRANDIPVGQKITGVIQKVSAEGIVLQIEETFEATVPEEQISDIKLVYPERKFKIGTKAKGRVLNVRSYGSKTYVTVTLKRSLVSASEDEIVKSYNELSVGKHILGTVQKINLSGCVISFFGGVSGFLPVSEISETYVENPNDYVKLGQTVRVRVQSFDPSQEKCLVSLRVGAADESQLAELKNLAPGKTITQVEILEKLKDAVKVKFVGSDLHGTINVSHLADGPADVGKNKLKNLKIGEHIEALLLNIDERRNTIILTSKPSLLEDSKTGLLPTSFSDISVSDKIFHGFVKTVIPTGVFVSFANNLTGLVIPRYATSKRLSDLTTAFVPGQSVSCSVVDIDERNSRFLLSLLVETANAKEATINPVDKSIKKLGEYTIGKVTKVVIKEVCDTHLLVKLADNQDGRVDITQIFNDVSDIEDLKNPLKSFKVGEKLDAKITGFFDIEKQKFIHSKKSKTNLVELTIRPSDLESSESVFPIAFKDVKEGADVLGYISAVGNGYFWYTISPAQRARMSFVDVTDDVTKLENFNEEFKVGTVVPAKVTAIDLDHYAISVSGRSKSVKFAQEVQVGDILPSLILNVRDNSVLVSLGENVTAVSMATDALDDYTLKLSDVFHVGEFHTATVVSTERKIYVSLRGKNSKDRLIDSVENLKRGDIVRGYVNKMNDSGLFVDLGRTVYALVRVSDISDDFIKDWKKLFHVNQSVRGRILEAGSQGRVLMSLKASVVNGDMKNLKSYNDLKVGDVFEGTIKKVAEFGAFVNLDGTDNVSGLCHRSEITDGHVANVEEIFTEGERVKVKILGMIPEKKQLSLGMKASYFKDHSDEESAENQDGDVEMEDSAAVSDDEKMDDVKESDDEEESADEMEVDDEQTGLSVNSNEGLSAGGLSTGFDWTASILEQAKDDESSDEEEEFNKEVNKKNKKAKKAAETEDKTGDLNTRIPQSISDFERLLVGNPDSSILWIQYMSFQLQLSEIDKAREIAERALKLINFREEQQKMNIWIALLNLENSFGDDESLQVVFKRACQYMDAYTMHQKLVAIYIASEKFDKADELFGVLCKKFGSKNPSAWVTYGSFLIDRNNNEEAHKVLAKALQILPKREHVDVVRKFAQLEFQKGDPEQGRSLFEGLLSDVPKRIDLWNVYIDQEIKLNKKAKVDELFERVVEKKLTRKQAKFFFAKWLSFEESHGDEKSQDYVKAKAAEFAQKLSK